MPEADDFEWYDEYMSSKILFVQDGEHMRSAKIISRAHDDMGNMIGVNNSNLILGTHVCGIMFTDGPLQKYSGNVIY